MGRKLIGIGLLVALCGCLAGCYSWRYYGDEGEPLGFEEQTLDFGPMYGDIPLHGEVINDRPYAEAQLEGGTAPPQAWYGNLGINGYAGGRVTQDRAALISLRRGDHRKAPWIDIGMNEEVWIIASAGDKPAVRGKGYPTQGELRAVIGEEKIPLPLKHTAVKATVSAFVSSVKVVQRYHNPYDTKIEAVYVFPLPQSSAVTDFVMTVGDRQIRGMIREREEAELLYRQAKRQGYRAALLTQERPNVFTQRVANIEPGKKIDIQIAYFNPLQYRDGDYEFVFPMVVGPRFNPPGSTDGVGAVARGRHGVSGQKTEVQYLRPGERSGHDISLQVDIDAGVEIERAYSRSHVIDVERLKPSRISVSLARKNTIPNKDFVLRYGVAGERLKTALLVDKGERGNTFALVLHPPKHTSDIPRMAREMVFVLDCSGSMDGAPIEKAKQAMSRCLRNLDGNDTFQVIRFSESASQLGKAPLPATRKNVRHALEYVKSLQGSGGTMMVEGIKAALDFPHDDERLRVVSFMTDGYIGNEAEILAAVHRKLGDARIFSFGVGDSVNRYLLERMASFGKGAAAFVGLDESAGEKVDAFYERIAHPALTDIRIDWGGMKVSDVYPRKIPDIFVGRPVMITGRFEGDGRQTIRLTGRTGGQDCAHSVDVDLDASGAQHSAITSLWARWRIKDFSERSIRDRSQELRDMITETSLAYNLLCRYTAFLAVDSTERTKGESGVSVNVPVPVPNGVRYETTVR